MKIAKDSLLTTRRIAHRGLHDNKTIPENSLAAFRNAVEHGYGVELDVYLTDDGTLIVHHDPSLKRTCGVKIHPEKIDSSHLENYRLMNTDETIPRLKDVLELVDGKIGLVIEIKTTRKVDAVCAAVRDMLKDYKGEYWIESFDPRIVRWWHEHCPDVSAHGRRFRGLWGSMLLGVLLALSFCPESAIVYFGMLMPLSARSSGGYLLPVVFSLATSVPAVLLAWAAAYGIGTTQAVKRKMSVAQRWINVGVGALFIGAGVFMLFF